MAKSKTMKKPVKTAAKKKAAAGKKGSVKSKAKVNPKADLNKDKKISEYEGKRAAAIAKSKKKAKAKSKTKALKESLDIANFIYAVSSKNYAQANKYLVRVVESKLCERIDQAINSPLF